MKSATALLFAAAILVSVGCKSNPGTSASAGPATSSAAAEAAAAEPSEPPTVDVGLSVDQAYFAMPHRRTIWREDDSTVPSTERAYLRAAFQVLDQAVAVRVAGQQNFADQHFDSPDIDGQYARLIAYAQVMPVPAALASYHTKILDALAGERQYFADWKSERERFQFGRQPGNHPGVRRASSNLRAAYGELMAKYPQESQSNKDAFFDYHCALDFL